MDPDPHRPAAVGTAGAHGAAGPAISPAEEAVTALYEAHALGMIRLAHVMLGDRQGAEDVVQEAFCGLYRRWPHLSDPGSAVNYVRSAVLNQTGASRSPGKPAGAGAVRTRIGPLAKRLPPDPRPPG